jgi:uncharacterized protein YhaN
MIIKDIHIDGFGIFNGFHIETFTNGINIVTGQNESGKSTLLNFIRFTLFGYPRLRGERMPPLNGGNHGGRIKALLSSGREIIFERNGNDQITFYDEGQLMQDKSQWMQFLGNTTGSIFENIYAFSLTELVDLKSLTASGLEDRIFSIGSGLGNISIGAVSDNIQASIEQIYNPRGRQQIIPGILNRIGEKKDKISEIQEYLPAYENLNISITNLLSESESLEKEILGIRNEKERNENYLKCYKSFIDINNIDTELSGMPELKDYPPDGLVRLKQYEDRENELTQKIDELKDGNDDGPGINDIESELRKLSFNDNILTKNGDVEFLVSNIQLYKKSVAELDENSKDKNVLEQKINGTLKDINSGWTEKNINDLNEIVVHQDRIKSFKKEFETYREKRLESEAHRKARDSSKSSINAGNLIIFLSMIVFLGSLLLFYYSLPVPGILCLLAAMVMLISRRYIIVKNPLEEYDSKLQELTAAETGLKNRFEQYLSDILDIDRNLSPDAVLEILTTIISLKQDINDRDRIVYKQDEKEQFIAAFKERTLQFKDILPNGDATDIENFVRQISSEYHNSKEKSERNKMLDNQLSDKNAKLTRAKADLLSNDILIKQILDSVKAQDRDEFRSKYRVNEQVSKLKEERKKEISTIETIAGIGKYEEVSLYLGGNPKENIISRISELGESISQKNEDLKQKSAELGANRNELTRIERESDLAEIMTELEMEKQKLEIAYKEWITNKIAFKILAEVRERFEKEKQPAVIRNSSIYFKAITGNKFNRISASMDKKEITVFDSREAAKKIDQLSRGTREQLLISLRLGFIEEYESHAEPLPVVVDDIFVNFDPQRTGKAAEIFTDFGQNRQVIIFTCHPSTLEYFDKSKVNVISLT